MNGKVGMYALNDKTPFVLSLSKDDGSPFDKFMATGDHHERKSSNVCHYLRMEIFVRSELVEE